MGIELCAIDAPHEYKNVNIEEVDEDAERIELTWWRYDINKEISSQSEYRCNGLVESIVKVANEWSSELESQNYYYEGIIGFSQGARLTHYLSLLHQLSDGTLFPGLKFVIMAAGYDDPIPIDDLINAISVISPAQVSRVASCFESNNEVSIRIPSLHIYGTTDRLISPTRSKKLKQSYNSVKEHVHNGGHHVPMRSNDVQIVLDFITSFTSQNASERFVNTPELLTNRILDDADTNNHYTPPSDENKVQQLEEVEVLEAIYPEEFKLVSNLDDNPITFEILIEPAEGEEELWPKQSIFLKITYPSTYPETVLNALPGGGLSLRHSMNVFEFSSSAHNKCLEAAANAALNSGSGIVHVLACVTAIRDFFGMGRFVRYADSMDAEAIEIGDCNSKSSFVYDRLEAKESSLSLLYPTDQDRMNKSDEEGKFIANELLKNISYDTPDETVDEEGMSSVKGGSWKFVIGLVGKPSAGKSTFFNAATCFARQRDKEGYGASMAPHPFTTIDPNVGYCFVPAPHGSCPENSIERGSSNLSFGNTHGRDSRGRRLLPVMLKDVAGLVPGAYEGRGKGNK